MSKLLQQHNAITEARYEMSSLEKNIVYLLMAELNENDPPEKDYIVQVNKLRVLFPDLTTKDLDVATTNLINTTYEIFQANGDILVVGLMGFVRYDPGPDLMYIRISREILPYFVALKKDYTIFQMDVAFNLHNKYAKRIYEVLCQYKNDRTFSIEVDDLKWRLGLMDKSRRKEKYTDISSFREHVLDVAKDELNRMADLTFDYELVKTGNKYTSLRFEVIRNIPLSKQPLKILIVDDMRFLCASYSNSIKGRRPDLVIDHAVNGQEAVNKVQVALSNPSESYRAIIMDIQMPVMDGVAASIAIRKLGFKGIIVAHTSMVEDQANEAFKKGDFDQLINKADGVEKLFTIIDRIV